VGGEPGRPNLTKSEVLTIRDLWRNAQVALNDARAPAGSVSAQGRFSASYDCALICAFIVLECVGEDSTSVSSPSHHEPVLQRLVKQLQVACPVPVRLLVQTKYESLHGVVPVADEQLAAQAATWADRVLVATERWVQQHQPSALL
jgi:hypothetical protein